MNTELVYRRSSIEMTIGSALVIGFDPEDINSRADAILTAYEAKVATILKFVDTQTADIRKLAISDVAKAAMLDEIAKVAEAEHVKAAHVARAEVEALKELPQPPKGIVAVTDSMRPR